MEGIATSFFSSTVMVVDGRWTTVGSTNLEHRSFRLNDEANLNVLDERFAMQQVSIFANDRQN
jgi:cardiolipin synthase A/B